MVTWKIWTSTSFSECLYPEVQGTDPYSFKDIFGNGKLMGDNTRRILQSKHSYNWAFVTIPIPELINNNGRRYVSGRRGRWLSSPWGHPLCLCAKFSWYQKLPWWHSPLYFKEKPSEEDCAPWVHRADVLLPISSTQNRASLALCVELRTNCVKHLMLTSLSSVSVSVNFNWRHRNK